MEILGILAIVLKVVTAIDIFSGWLPDKYCKWPGIILSIGNKMFTYGKDLPSSEEGK